MSNLELGKRGGESHGVFSWSVLAKMAVGEDFPVMAISGPFSGISDQLPDIPGFATGIEYVNRILTPGTEEHERLMAVPVGVTSKVDFGGGVFSLEQAYLTKSDEEVRWEAHRGYLDLQVVVTGNEIMEVTDPANLTLEEDFSPDRDLQYFSRFGPGSLLRVSAGGAAVFFPVDAHRPGLADGESTLVRKVVVKIPLG